MGGSGQTPTLQLRNVFQDKWTNLCPFVCFARGVLLCFSVAPSPVLLLKMANEIWWPSPSSSISHVNPSKSLSQCLCLRFPSSGHPNWSPLKSQCCHKVKAAACLHINMLQRENLIQHPQKSILRAIHSLQIRLGSGHEVGAGAGREEHPLSRDGEPGLWQRETRLPVTRANKWGSTVSTRDSRLCTDVMDSFP